jgi:integrase
MIQRYYRTKIEAGLAPRTVAGHHLILSAALSAAVRLQLIYRNPVAQVAPPRAPRRVPRVLSREQINDLLTILRDTDLYLPAMMAALCGMRESEILALRWADIDLDAGIARLTGSITHTKARGTERKSTKTERGRPLILARPVVEALRLHRSSSRPGEYICPRKSGEPQRQATFSTRWMRKMAKLGIAITFHELRHSYATLALEIGIHPLVVKEALGHSRVGITLDTYSHVQPALEEDAAQRIADAVYKQDSRQDGAEI